MAMNKSIRRIRAALMVVVPVFCFAGAAAAQGAPKIDSCTLLTKAEIQAAIGQSVGDGKLNTEAAQRTAAEKLMRKALTKI
jgi:hypothetical protein